MRRVLAFVFAGVLIGALCSIAAFTLASHPSEQPVPSGSQADLGARIFGQPPNSGGYLSKLPHVFVRSLAYNRVFSLHDATDRYGSFTPRPVFQVGPAPANSTIALNSVSKYTGPILIGSTIVVPDKPASGVPVTEPSQTPLTANQNVASLTGGSNANPSSAGLVDDTPSAFDSRMQDSSMSVSMPIRVGAVSLENFNSTAQFNEAPSADAPVHNYTWTAATNFDVQAKNRALNVNLNTDYSHLNTGQVASFAYNVNSDAASISDLQAVNPALFASTATAPLDLTSHSIGGGLALPLNHRVTLGLQYGAQRFTGAYGLASTPNLDTSKYSYLGNLTFALRPNTAITLSARQYHYQDNLVPSNNYYQTSTNLNFTVKL